MMAMAPAPEGVAKATIESFGIIGGVNLYAKVSKTIGFAISFQDTKFVRGVLS